jgi:hypothetical protein
MAHPTAESATGPVRRQSSRALVMSLAAVTILLLSIATAASAQSTDTPEYAAGLVIGEIASGNAAAAWQHLHPAQQRVVSQQAYVTCRASKGTLAIDTANTRELGESAVRITIPGTRVKATATAVSIKVVLTNGQSQNITVHEVRVKRAWRYLLNANEVQSCRGS